MRTVAESALKNIKLLVVPDDNHINRRLLQALFHSEGCVVTLAENGYEALPALQAHSPDIVLLDLKMPGMDGIQTLRELRSAKTGIPILMLTSYGDLESAVEATGLGADDFISRPISNDDLVTRVAHAVEHRKLLSELEALRVKLAEGQFIRRLMSPSAAMASVIDSVRRVAKIKPHRVDHRRDRDRQGTGRARGSRGERAARRSVYRGRLWRAARKYHRVRAVRISQGRIHRRRSPETRLLRCGRGRDSVPRRVGNLPPSTQIKLLRVIQEREFARWAAFRRHRSMFASSPQAMRSSRPVSRRRASVPTSTIASQNFPLRFRRSALGAMTFRCSRDVSWRKRRWNCAVPSAASLLPPSRCSTRIHGRETSGNCAM